MYFYWNIVDLQCCVSFRYTVRRIRYAYIHSFLIFLSPIGHHRVSNRAPCAIHSRSIYFVSAAAAAKSLQSCPTLCDPIDGSPPGSPVPGILQARVLEWVAIAFSDAWKWTVKVKSLSSVQLLATPWTAAYQALPPMGFSRLFRPWDSPGKSTGVGCH